MRKFNRITSAEKTQTALMTYDYKIERICRAAVVEMIFLAVSEDQD
jgi:hypothetical protein